MQCLLACRVKFPVCEQSREIPVPQGTALVLFFLCPQDVRKSMSLEGFAKIWLLAHCALRSNRVLGIRSVSLADFSGSYGAPVRS